RGGLAVGERPAARRGEGGREGPDLRGPDRQAGRGAVTAEALEVRRARRERRVEVERSRRSPRPLPVAVRAGDQHDRPAEALDETRGDDPDHALVPVGTGENVPSAAPSLRRPRLDLVDRGTEDALLDRLPFAVQRLELVRTPP